MMPDLNAAGPDSEPDLVAQWCQHIGTPFPSNYTIKFELQQRVQLHFRGEESVRAGRHSEFAEYRAKNAQRLFEILRTADLRAARLLVDVNYLECRLLRQTSKFDECRQLCQSMPVYSWDYAMLQEYIWATKRDDYPHERFRAFKDEQDKLMVQRFVQSARIAYEEDLAKWTSRRDEETKPPPLSRRDMIMGGFAFGVPYVAAYLSWTSVGIVGAIVIFFAGLIVLWLMFAPFMAKTKLPRERVRDWESLNPRPVSRISDKPD